MESKHPWQYYCQCGTRLARDNTDPQCARCQRESRDKLITPPQVPPEFWQTEQFEEAFAAQHMGWVARAYRTHPYHHAVYGPGGISQTLLGQWVGLRQPHVSRFETGPPIQHLDTLRRWARVLRIPPALLWFDLPGEKRMIAELRKMDDVAGGGSVLTMAQQLLGWAGGLLDRASYSEHTGQALHVVLAELGQLCGWAACDAGDYGLAQRYNIAALRAAHAADDHPLGAHILAAMTNQAARHGQPAEGVTFIETALAGSRGRATPALLAELHIWQALAFATLRDASACTAAISQARTQVDQLKPDDDPSWLYWLDPTAITITAGNCHLLLGQAGRGVVLLDEGIAELSESFVRDRQLHLTQLAEARARPGKQRDLDAAAGLGLQALDLAGSLNSARGTALLHGLYLRMKLHNTVPAVREFLERVERVGEG